MNKELRIKNYNTACLGSFKAASVHNTETGGF